MESAIDQLADLVKPARRAVIFTGAGISTESGVPDFRSPGGLWERVKPTPFREFLASPEARLRAWRNYRLIHQSFATARPGRGHEACASLIARGHAQAVITQNIDDLHRLSGIAAEAIVELHGNGTYAACLACGERHTLDWAFAEIAAREQAPDCRSCGGPVKSATIAFGQPMPQVALKRASDLTRASDLFLALGSSLSVLPAAGLPRLAAELGIPLVIINTGETPLDGAARLVIRADLGTTLQALLSRIANHDP